MTCDQCGTCCKIFLINLNEEEYRSGNFKTQFSEFVSDFELASFSGANTLAQKEDGSCIYLKDQLCSIHMTRPLVCRDFFCDTTEERFQGMVHEIRAFKENF